MVLNENTFQIVLYKLCLNWSDGYLFYETIVISLCKFKYTTFDILDDCYSNTGYFFATKRYSVYIFRIKTKQYFLSHLFWKKKNQAL